MKSSTPSPDDTPSSSADRKRKLAEMLRFLANKDRKLTAAQRQDFQRKANNLEILAKAKLSGTQLNSGTDPETIQAGITLAGWHIESGSRTFAAYSKAMIDDLGEAVRPYLRSFYESVRFYPGFDAAGMSTAAEIERGNSATNPATLPPSQPEAGTPSQDATPSSSAARKRKLAATLRMLANKMPNLTAAERQDRRRQASNLEALAKRKT